MAIGGWGEEEKICFEHFFRYRSRIAIIVLIDKSLGAVSCRGVGIEIDIGGFCATKIIRCAYDIKKNPIEQLIESLSVRIVAIGEEIFCCCDKNPTSIRNCEFMLKLKKF